MVSLVGSGPGDPGLITVLGAARLAEADVIVYDRLANPMLLGHAKPGAQLIDAGKQPDRHTLTQDEINASLIEHARAGKRVVRLKGGDPFVFGRGGEEAEALRGAGVAFEVVPGVTSAVAVPAYAGVPVTHRALSSSFTVVTAHEDPGKEETAIDWAQLARGVDTIVVLMGVTRLEAISGLLIEHGRSPETPVAVIESGTLPAQRTVSGTLSSIATDAAGEGVRAPAVIVIGEVARLRERLRWYDTRPLFGRRVLVTRMREQASALSEQLMAAGAEVIELPAIEIVETSDPVEVERAITALRASAYQWCVFTSQNAVDIFLRLVRESGRDMRTFARTQLAAIGPGTEAALGRHGLNCDAVPERYVAEGLLERLAPRVLHGQRVLIPRAESARESLLDGLGGRGAIVDELKLYRAAVPSSPSAEGLERLRSGDIDIITFASSSAVRNLVEMLDGDLSAMRKPLIAAIGPVTAAAVREAGLSVTVEASVYTIDGLVTAIVEHAGAAGRKG
jgi:uroporphyrinogen III methyltransferase/synthase